MIETKLTGDASDLMSAFDKGVKSGDAFDRGIRNSADGADRGMRKSSAGMIGSMKALAVGVGAFFIARQITDWARDSMAALANWEVIAAQTNAVIESTGGAAGVTAEHINKLSQSLEASTASQAEQIQEGANLLLTFKNIRNEVGEGNNIFDQSTAAMVDMARAMGTDVAGGAIKLGKALNDPIAGVAALNRVGVQFTDGQKEMIKSMVESGDTMGAQKIILAELNAQFGGSGAAYADTYAGKMYLLKDSVGDLGEVIFSGLMPLLAELAPVATAAFQWLAEQPAVSSFGQNLVDTFKGIGVAVLPIITMLSDTLGPVFAELAPLVMELFAAFSPLMTVFSEGSGVMPILVDIIGALAEMLKQALPPIIEIGNAMGDAFVDVLGVVLPIIAELVPMVGELLMALLPLLDPILAMGEAFLPLLPVIGELIGAILPPLIGLLLAIVPPIVDLLIPALKFVADIITFVADAISGLIGWLTDMNTAAEKEGMGMAGWFEFLGGVIKGVFDVIGFVIGWFVDIVKTNFDRAIESVHIIGNVFSTVFGAIGGFIESAFTNALVVVKGAINGIISLVNGAIGALNGLKVSIPDWVPGLGGKTYGVNLPRIPMLASGGTITAPGLSWVGEKGPELVNLPRGAQVIDAARSVSLASSLSEGSGSMREGDTYNIYVTVDGSRSDSPEEVGAAVGAVVRFQLGG